MGLGCQFIGSLVRALIKLLAGIARFLTCPVGKHLSRLSPLGWEQCSHGLTARPRGSCHPHCLEAVCGLLGHPAGAAAELLDGTLKLRHCTRPFGKRFSQLSSFGFWWWLGETGWLGFYPLRDGKEGMALKRVRLPRKTCPAKCVHSQPEQGLPTPK